MRGKYTTTLTQYVLRLDVQLLNALVRADNCAVQSVRVCMYVCVFVTL